jgi:hypothetical protein
MDLIMKYKQIKFETIAHYLRMMFEAMWFLNDDESYDFLSSQMDESMQEEWYDRDCSYCIEYNFFGDCDDECSLKTFGENCCNGLWDIMDESRTWNEWLINAHKVLKYIIDTG